MNQQIKDKKAFFKEWLEKLQQESWQLELLISGFALYGIWESRVLGVSLAEYVSLNVSGIWSLISNIILQIFYFGWVIFFTNLLIHIILRGLWIGAIGLRYVSGDVDFDALNYSDLFTKFLKKKVGSFDDYIERLERLCSVLFAFTFLLFFLFISIFVFLIEIVLIFYGLSKVLEADNVAGSTYVALVFFIFFGLGFLVLIDFIGLGFMKRAREKSISRVYFFIYRFFSFITFSFIFRPLLYNFIDDRYTRKFFLMSIPYGVCIIYIFPNFFIEANPYFPPFNQNETYISNIAIESVIPHYYDDLREAGESYTDKLSRKEVVSVSLNKYEVDEHVATIFLKQYRQDDKLMKLLHPEINAFRKPGLRHAILRNRMRDEIIDSLRREEDLEIISMEIAIERGRKISLAENDSLSIYNDYFEYYKKFDESQINELGDSISEKWKLLRIAHVGTQLERLKQVMLDFYTISIDTLNFSDSLDCEFYEHQNLGEKGLLCYFPTKSLSPGKHIVTIERKVFNESRWDSIWISTLKLPFRYKPE